MAGLAMIDGRLMPIGEAVLPVTDPAFTVGWSVFETLAWPADERRLGAHLGRLEESARAACVPWPAAPLQAEVLALAEAFGAPCRLRVTLTAGGRRVLVATPIDPSRWHHPVRAVRGPHREEPFLGGRVKHGSRAPWMAAVARSGVDEVLLVDEEGRFTEGTTCAVLAVIGGALWTAPDDGRILASTTVGDLLERAAGLGIAVIRQGPPAAGPWEGLYIASSLRDLAPVVELDGVGLPGWDPVGRRLAGSGRWG